MFFDPAYQSLKNGLVGYWSPVATGPTGLQLLDLSGQNNHGTLTNMDAPTDWVQSPYGTVLDFDGSNDYVTTLVDLAGRTQVGISLWYWRSSSSHNFYCGAGVGNSNGPRANIYFSGTTLYMTAESGPGPKYIQINNVTNTGWMHIFYRYNGNAASQFVRLLPYVNGNLLSFAIANTLPTSLGNVGNFEIGRTLGENLYGTGQVASAALWFRDLSEGEIQTLYKLGPKDFVNTKPNVSIAKRKWWPGVKTPKSRPIIPTQRGIKSGPIFYDPKASWFRNGLVGHWCPNLTGPTGTQLLDLSGQNNNGTLTNMDAATDWVQSPYGTVLDFDGLDDRIPVNFTPFLGPLTAACWIRRNGNPAAVEVPFSCSQDSGSFNQMFFISVETNGTIRYQGSSGGVVNNLISTTTIGTNQWRLVVGTGTFGTSFSLYVDGVLEGTKTGGGSNSISGVAGVIGAYNQAATFNRFTGQIAGCSLWNRELTATEIQQLYQRGPGGFAARKPYRRSSYSPAPKKIFKSRIDRKRSVSLVHPDHDNEWITNGLVGFWCPSLTSPTGTQLLDLSGQNNNGTLTNMTPNTAWVTSGGKGALEFDGSNDFVLCTNPGPATTNRTICAWFKTSTVLSANTYGAIVGWGAGTISQGFIIGFGNDANFGNNGFGVSQWGDAIGVTGFNDGNWHFGVVTNTGNSWRIYVDGLFRTSKTMSTTPTAKSIYFGRYEASPFGYFNGQVDDVRIYDRALTEDEIAKLYAGGRGCGFSNKPSRSPTWMVEADETIGNRRRRIICGGKN